MARAWIAQGDVENRGSRRAHELSTHWRDRDNDTLALLAAALPHATTPWELSNLLWAVIRRMPGTTHPDHALGDNLIPHALADTPDAESAQLALGLLGNEHLLTDIPDPEPRGLAALATRTHNLDHQQLALRHPHTRPDELAATLTPHTAHILLRDLTNLLHRRPTATLVRRFGDWSIHDTELLARRPVRPVRAPGRAGGRSRRTPRPRYDRGRGPRPNCR
ncbi:hypothetical protein [Embleya sp. NPDC059237]|uniref:hypothetical protein n=1 Tax=Embleya sp. NPDC059237 TaxID=3346784 RepID=UPI0036A84D38